MPVLSFTADATTDQLTATAHGLLTGDGPMLVLAAAFPGGLAVDVPYWAIRVDADHIKLATSNSNAVAGTAINITSNGTGPMTLRVGLPDIEDLTYVGGSQISSKNLMNMQRSIIAAYRLLTGQVQSIWDGITLAANQHVTVSGTGGYRHGDLSLTIGAGMFRPEHPLNAAGPVGGAASWISFQAPPNDYVRAWIPLPTKKRIKSISFRVDKNNVANNFFATLRKYNDANDNGATIGSSLSIAASTPGAASYVMSSINYEIEADTSLSVDVQITSASVRFYRAVVIYDQIS